MRSGYIPSHGTTELEAAFELHLPQPLTLQMKWKGEGLPKVTQPVLPSYSGLSVQRKGAAPNGYGLVKKVLRRAVGYDNSASGGSGG